VKHLELSVADPLWSGEPVELTIRVSRRLPEITAANLDEIRALYEAEAAELADALAHSLPQGTRHALLLELLRRHEVLYRGL
jgi:hypothetical protein